MTTQRARLSIVSFTNIGRDARVLRQVRSLAATYRTTVITHGQLEPELREAVEFQRIVEPQGPLRRNLTAVPKLMLGKVSPSVGYEAWYWQRRDHRHGLDLLIRSQPAVILANDWSTLPVAVRAAQACGARVLLDLHEYYPLQRTDHIAWRTLIQPLIEYHLRRDLGRVDATLTVGHTIADRYREEYGIEPAVVTNAPYLVDEPAFRPTDPESIRLIHHGAASPDRKLEILIEAVARSAPRFSLHFRLLDSNARYIASLRKLSARLAPGRVHFEPPIAPSDIVKTIAEYDLGAHILVPTTFNHHAALPNKFFDFVCAGLGVVIGPSPEMARLTREHGFGIVAEGFDPGAVARVLANLDARRVDELKRAAVVARRQLSAATQMERLSKVVAELAHAGSTGTASPGHDRPARRSAEPQ